MTAPHGSDAAPVAPTPSSWLVPVLTLATFVTMLQAMALGPLLPDIAADLDTSVALLGQIPAAMMILAAMIGFFAGPLADRFGHHRVLLGSLLTLVISTVGMAMAPGYLLLLIAALLGSVGRAVVQPVAMVIAGERFTGDRQQRAISWVMAGMSGAVIAGVPALTTIADAFGWRVALASLAALTAAMIPAVSHGLGPSARHTPTEASRTRIVSAYSPLIHHRPTLGLVVASMLGNTGIWILATYLGAFYAERHGYTTQQIGWVYFVPGVTLFLGSLAAGGRIGTLSLCPLVVTTRAIAGVAIASVLILPLPAFASLGLLGVLGGVNAVSMVAVVLLLIQESPAGRATTLTLNTVALSLGIALGSMLGGVLLAIGDFELLGLASLVLSCGSAALVWSTRAQAVAPKPVPAPNIS